MGKKRTSKVTNIQKSISGVEVAERVKSMPSFSHGPSLGFHSSSSTPGIA